MKYKVSPKCCGQFITAELELAVDGGLDVNISPPQKYTKVLYYDAEELLQNDMTITGMIADAMFRLGHGDMNSRRGNTRDLIRKGIHVFMAPENNSRGVDYIIYNSDDVEIWKA